MTTIYARITQNQNPTYKDIVIDQGSTFSDTITLKNIDDTPFDITNYSVRAQLRRTPAASSSVDFTCTKTDAANGVFTMSLTSVQTAALTVQNYMPTIYVYDIEIYTSDSPPIVYRVLRGRAKVEPEVTR